MVTATTDSVLAAYRGCSATPWLPMTAQRPDFIGLGTQKGGTTTLHQLLQSHPDVFLPAAKELHCFDQQPDRPRSSYEQQFEKATADQRCGEITPFFMFHPDVPARIHDLLPEVKLIVLLRDTVERALSRVFHSRRRRFEPRQPAEAQLCGS